MFCEYCSWFEPLRENDDIAGLAAPRRVQDPHPSEGEVSLETTTLCLFPFIPNQWALSPPCSAECIRG